MLPVFLLMLSPADTSPLPTMAEWVHDWEIQRDFTLAVAEKMPAKDYGFKATPEEIAAVVAFVASTQSAAINGAAAPAEGGVVRSIF